MRPILEKLGPSGPCSVNSCSTPCRETRDDRSLLYTVGPSTPCWTDSSRAPHAPEIPAKQPRLESATARSPYSARAHHVRETLVEHSMMEKLRSITSCSRNSNREQHAREMRNSNRAIQARHTRIEYIILKKLEAITTCYPYSGQGNPRQIRVLEKLDPSSAWSELRNLLIGTV